MAAVAETEAFSLEREPEEEAEGEAGRQGFEEGREIAAGAASEGGGLEGREEEEEAKAFGPAASSASEPERGRFLDCFPW